MALEAAVVLRDAADDVIAGPAWWIVLGGAVAAYLLARNVTRVGLPAGFVAIVGVLASMVFINVLVHLAIAGNLQVWSGETISRFPFEGTLLPEEYLSDADPARAEGSARSLVVVALVLLWLRFLWIGRSPVTFENVTRSFTTGFVIVLCAALLGAARGSTGPGILAVLYFVIGMLTLAISNTVRATQETQGLERSVPWAASVLVTVALLGITGLVFGVLTVLDVGRVISPLGELLQRFIVWALILILTPVFWLLGILLSPLAGLLDGLDARFDEVFQSIGRALFVDPEARAALSDNKLPRWLRDGARLLATAAVIAGLYFGGRLLFRRMRRTRDSDTDYQELRGNSAGGGTGLGSLLRDLLPRDRGENESGAWLRRQSVYRLYARLATIAAARGFPRREGETPIEYADAAGRVFAAPFFPGVAMLFDGARYGRHYPEQSSVDALDADLERWEEANPVTEELLSRVGRKGVERPELDSRVHEGAVTPRFDEPALPDTTDFSERI